MRLFSAAVHTQELTFACLLHVLSIALFATLAVTDMTVTCIPPILVSTPLLSISAVAAAAAVAAVAVVSCTVNDHCSILTLMPSPAAVTPT